MYNKRAVRGHATLEVIQHAVEVGQNVKLWFSRKFSTTATKVAPFSVVVGC